MTRLEKRRRQKQARGVRKAVMTEMREHLTELLSAKDLTDHDAEAIREWAAREGKRRAGVGRPVDKKWLT